MSVEIIATQDFARRLKKLIKKYKSIGYLYFNYGEFDLIKVKPG